MTTALRRPPMTAGSDAAPLLIRGAAVLTLDAADRYLPAADILILGGRIAMVGDVPPEAVPAGTPVLEGRGFMAAPGMVNAHMHSPSSVMAGTSDGLSHPGFMWTNQADTANRTPDEVYVTALLACHNCLVTGTTAILDHFPAQNFTAADVDAAMRAYRDSGMRVVLGLRLFDEEFGDILPRGAAIDEELKADLLRHGSLPPRPLAELRELTEDAVRRHHDPAGRIQVFPSPTNPVRCSDALLEMCRDVAARHDLGVHTHLLESRVQREIAFERYGVSMVEHLDRLGLLDGRLSCAHSIWLEPDDPWRFAQAGTVAVTNPASNLKLATGVCRVPELLRAGATVALGTDGAITNDTMSLFEAMRFAAYVHRPGQEKRSEWVDARAALRMATAGGAAAMRWPDIGRIEAGARADLVLYDLDDAAWVQVNDPWQQLAFAETGSGVHTVIVAGRVLLRDRRVVAFDAPALKREARRVMAGIRERNRDLRRVTDRMIELFP